jgi:F-type H+-transporting ATPase subunit a
MKHILFLIVLFSFSTVNWTVGAETNNISTSSTKYEEELNVKKLILEHLSDSYEWHIFSTEKRDIKVHLPVILYSNETGWHFFLSSKLHNIDNNYKGFGIATNGKYKGKIVERVTSGEETRPLDLSITKNAASLLLSSFLLIIIILSVANSIKRDPLKPQKGFAGTMEMFILMINNEVIKPAIGEDYKRYSPYLLTIFFFIFFNNLLGLFPLFPGGANVTGNISVTVVLAIGTFLVVNLTGTKKYYKELFWPDTPVWLKVPFPLMQIIEIVGTLTKPFALMIRLFANIMAGHAIVLGLTSLIFVTVSLGTAINTSMSVVSVIFTIFIEFVELLVAFIQAYVFTLLSSVFIGLAREKEKEKDRKELAVEKLSEPTSHLEL